MRIDITIDCGYGVQIYTYQNPKDALKTLSNLPYDTYSIWVTVWVGKCIMDWGDFYLFDKRILPVN